MRDTNWPFLCLVFSLSLSLSSVHHCSSVWVSAEINARTILENHGVFLGRQNTLKAHSNICVYIYNLNICLFISTPHCRYTGSWLAAEMINIGTTLIKLHFKSDVTDFWHVVNMQTRQSRKENSVFLNITVSVSDPSFHPITLIYVNYLAQGRTSDQWLNAERDKEERNDAIFEL